MNGTMSFVELGKVMNTSWKGCDKLVRSVFDNLAKEGQRHYQIRLREYLDGAGGGRGGGCGSGPAIATATANAKAKAKTKATTVKAKKPTAAGGGRRKGKAGSPVEVASSATANFQDPPPLPPLAGYCSGIPPDRGHVNLRSVLADHSVTLLSCHDAMPPRREHSPPRQQQQLL